MSQASDLLNSLSADDVTVYANGSETEKHIVIGEDRIITVPESLRRIAVQHDHNVETVTFDCPRYWDGIDLSTMAIYINYLCPNRTLGAYIAQNVTIDESDSNVMHFDWTITRNITVKNGKLSFRVCIKNVDSEGNEINHWNSELNTDMYVSEGLETTEALIETVPDLLTQILLLNELTLTRASVYVGSGDMPEWANVQIDPDGEAWDASSGGDAVLYTSQSLTEEQKTQARANIGAGTPYTLPQASSDALGGIKADAAETADTQPVRIGGDGKLYTAPGGGGADISLGVSGATAGQMAKVKAVDGNGVPTEWEAGDAASGGSAWIELGDVTVNQTAEFVPLSFENGIVTIDTNADGYASLPSSGTISCIVHTINVKSKTNPVPGILKTTDYEAGTFEFYNRDHALQSSASYDPSTYKISILTVAEVVMENVPTYYKRYKCRVTTPVYSNHGLRQRYTCEGFTEIGCGADTSVNMGGGAIIETEFYPNPYDENHVYRRVRTAYGNFYGGGSGNEFQSFELIDSGSGKTKPQESGIISFKVSSMIFVNGTRFELWGTNDD